MSSETVIADTVPYAGQVRLHAFDGILVLVLGVFEVAAQPYILGVQPDGEYIMCDPSWVARSIPWPFSSFDEEERKTNVVYNDPVGDPAVSGDC